MNQKHRWTKGRILNGVIALLLMAMIFMFSANTGDESSELSRKVTEHLMRWIFPEYSAMGGGAQAGAFALMHFLVRKLAHFSEYALLGAALRQFLWTFPLKFPGLPAWLAATVYAVLDEWHQTFVSGRAGQFRDICIDSAGALFGVLVAAGITAVVMSRVRQKQTINRIRYWQNTI